MTNMKRIRASLIILAAALAVSCNNSVSETTEVSGELLAGSQADSIKVNILNGRSMETAYVFPVVNDHFEFTVPTDDMKLAVVTLKGVARSASFVPEGVPMKILMAKDGSLRVTPQGKETLTEAYNSLSKNVKEYQKVLADDLNAVIKENNYNRAERDSIVHVYSLELTKYMENLCRDLALSNTDNAVGLMSVLSLSTIVSKEDLAPVVSKMDKCIRNQKDVMKALAK